MTSRRLFFIAVPLMVLASVWILSPSNTGNEDLGERAKIALRSIGDQLLKMNEDRTSLVLPIIELEEAQFELSFEDSLYILPDSLSAISARSFQKHALPSFYRMEVIRCKDEQVAYSYEMKADDELANLSCKERILPISCYRIETRFFEGSSSSSKERKIVFLLGLLIAFILFFSFKRKWEKPATVRDNGNYKSLGRYLFYPEQHKLIVEAEEIRLSKKECELLNILLEKVNQVVQRDELMKRVWEDNGVFVGRSLDTYISKLRKKLKDDQSIQIKNVHGIGYQLVLTKDAV